MNEEILRFPIFAVFIGANLGLASLSYVKEGFRLLALRAEVPVMIILIFAAILCVFSSNWFFSSIILAYFGIGLLLLCYFILIFVGLVVILRADEIAMIKRVIKGHSPNLAERIEEER